MPNQERKRENKQRQERLRQEWPERVLEDGRVVSAWLVVIYWKGRFLGWGTDGKKPVVYNVNRSDFYRSLSFEWGPYSEAAASGHMKLAKEYGTDFGSTVSPQELVKGNKLGDNGEELDLDQILEKFALPGMDSQVESHFGVIKMEKSLTEEEIEQEDEWWRKMIQESIEKHKQRCKESGFPFD